MPFCPNCGKELSEDTRFCPECGRPVAAGPVVKRERKKKLAGIIVACTLAIIAAIVLISVKPWEPTYTLSVNVNPPQTGFVSSSGGKYKSNMQVTLTASPASGYTFDYWSGGASGTAPTITITMDSDKSVTANFIATYTLSMVISPSGAGFVSPSGGEYESGVQVTLTASPASGYTFDYWSGDASGTEPTATVTMNSDKALTAHFAEVLLSDDFSDVNSGWVTYDGYDGWADYLNGHLEITDYTAYTGTIYAESQHYFTDFVLEVETWLVGGTDDNWQTVICRCQDNYKSYYDFGISADGYYNILKFINGNRITLVSPTYSSYINQGVGAVNLVHIECIGSRLGLSVNGHLLGDVTDTTLTGGDILLGANALSGTSTKVAFDNIVISRPSSTVPNVLFSDDFSDGAGVWGIFSADYGSVFYKDGWIHLINNAHTQFATGTYANQHFTDFILEVETKLVAGADANWHNVICRWQDADNYYVLDISADGYYAILKWLNGNKILLVSPTYSSYIYQGQGITNLMHIECIGSTLSLTVNGHILATITDTSFTGGDIGLSAATVGNTFTEVAFDDIVVSSP